MASSHPTSDEVRAFWNWFRGIAEHLAGDLDENQSAIDELDRRISEMGLAWELGPGESSGRFLAISPDGDKSLLEVSRRVVNEAPRIEGWTFFPAKPARSAALEFSIRGDSGSDEEIDAQNWKYVLYRNKNGTFDIVLSQPNLSNLSENDRYAAAVVCVDALLGEQLRLELVEEIECIDTFTEAQAQQANNIQSLAAQFTVFARARQT